MHDLAPEVAVAHFAEHADAATRCERLLLVRIEVEEPQDELRPRTAIVAIVFEQADELAPRPVLDVGGDDRALGLLLDAGLQCRERHDARVVLVAQRQVQHEVLVAEEPELDQLIVQAAPGGLRFVRGGFRRRQQIARPTLLPPLARPLTVGLEVFRTDRIMVAMIRLSRRLRCCAQADPICTGLYAARSAE